MADYLPKSSAQAFASLAASLASMAACSRRAARTVITMLYDHDQHPGDEERAAQGTPDIRGVHELDGLDEGVGQVAVIVEAAQHQALADAGDPHRGDVQHDADGGEPEVDVDQVWLYSLVSYSRGIR
jgi:hypothetical protein